MPPRRTLTRLQKDKILERDAYVCSYCLGEATTVDHIIPWSWSYDDSPYNLAAPCTLCNLLATDKIFRSLGEKTAYIMEQRGKKKHAHSKARPLEPARCIECGEVFRQNTQHSTLFLCCNCLDTAYRKFEEINGTDAEDGPAKWLDE